MELRRYIVLPSNGFRSTILNAGQLQSNQAMQLSRPGSRTDANIRVLDQVSADGPKLVEMSDDGEIALLRQYAGEIRVIPLHIYERPQPEISPVRGYQGTKVLGTSSTDGGTALEIWNFDVTAPDGRPVMGAQVIAFTNFRWKEGVVETTGVNGRAALALPPGSRVERLYVNGPAGYWGAYRQGMTWGADTPVTLQPIDPAASNLALARFRAGLPEYAGIGVRVGIIDTGIAKTHDHLMVTGGRNCVFDETLLDPGAADDWDDVDRHGSHVAGIVAGRPTASVAFAGVAPMAELRAYRVFPKDGQGASNFDIMKAIQFATQDGCHIINLSLGGTFLDEAVRAAVGDARGSGVLVVAAAGNDARSPVRYPAAYESAIAVSAVGLRSSFPAGSVEEADIAQPACSLDPDIFLAAFTNVGPQIKLAAPGVGIVSTVAGGFVAMSGTSMAAPMISGLAAAILSEDPALLAEPAESRVKRQIRLLLDKALTLGFQRDHEGAGMPIVAEIWRQAIAAKAG